jgi:hypothetical protein
VVLDEEVAPLVHHGPPLRQQHLPPEANTHPQFRLT